MKPQSQTARKAPADSGLQAPESKQDRGENGKLSVPESKQDLRENGKRPASESNQDRGEKRKLSATELIEEAKRQSTALKMIGRWRTIGFIISAVGALLLYRGVSAGGGNLVLTVVGLVIAAGGLTAAVLCDLGIRNGRRNVEKILKAAQDKTSR